MITCTKTEKIIIVDDIPALSSLIECLLEDAGFTNYLSFDDPLNALEYIKNNEPVNLIITDFYMPEMNGLELLERAKEIRNQIQGIIVSSAPSLVPSDNHDFIIMEKGKQLNEKLIGQVKMLM